MGVYVYNNGAITKIEDEMFHSGVRGMKWGIRRYQYKDGSLTPEGRRRYSDTDERIRSIKNKAKATEKALRTKAKNQAKINKAKAKADARIEKAKERYAKKVDPTKKKKPDAEITPVKQKPVNKSIKDMTDSELRDYVNRLKLENDYSQAMVTKAKNTNERIRNENEYKTLTATPKKVSAGKKFIMSVLNDVVAPAAKEVGKDYLKKVLKDMTGLSDEKIDPLKGLKDKESRLKLESQISKYQKDIFINASDVKNRKQSDADKEEKRRQEEEKRQKEEEKKNKQKQQNNS